MADILDRIPVNDEMTIFETRIDAEKLNYCIDNILKRLATLEHNLQTPKQVNYGSIRLSKEEITKFRNLLGIFCKDFKERANTDIDLFVNICNNTFYDMLKELDKEEF
jgi:hypothetical protein